MEIDAITRSKLKNVVFTSTEPPSTNVLWAKPNGNEVTMYIFKNGSWQALTGGEIDSTVYAYIDTQDAATLASAKEYADSSLATEITKVNETEATIQNNVSTNATDISTLKGYFEDGVANKAKQLATEVTLWGNKFDGTTSIEGTSNKNGDLINIGNAGNSNFCIEGVAANVDYTHLYITQNHRPIVMQYGHGNVGIGTATPSNKLEVSGTFKATGDTTIGGNLTVAGSITSTTSPLATKEWVTTVIEETQPKVWANVLAIKDTTIKVDGEKVELPAYKPVIIKNFSSVQPWEAKSDGETEYLTDGIVRFDFHYNDRFPINAFYLNTWKRSPYTQAHPNITQLDVSCWNTSGMTSMYGMFANYSRLTYLDVSGFDTSNVTSMNATFNGLQVTSLNVGGFDTSKVTDMQTMFTSCNKLTYVDVSNWDVGNVDTAYKMFCNCDVINNLDVSNWNAQIRNMEFMFLNCYALSSLDVSKWSTIKTTQGMSSMFYGCKSLTNIIFGEGWGKNTKALTLNLSTCASSKSYKLTDGTYESMLNMYDRTTNGLTATFTIQFSSNHNIPDGWTDKATARGYTITIS